MYIEVKLKKNLFSHLALSVYTNESMLPTVFFPFFKFGWLERVQDDRL